jgi:hypothetical protein
MRSRTQSELASCQNLAPGVRRRLFSICKWMWWVLSPAQAASRRQSRNRRFYVPTLPDLKAAAAAAAKKKKTLHACITLIWTNQPNQIVHVSGFRNTEHLYQYIDEGSWYFFFSRIRSAYHYIKERKDWPLTNTTTSLQPGCEGLFLYIEELINYKR